jgi:hypothetical protein
MRAFGLAWPCIKTFVVNAQSHSPRPSLRISFTTCTSTCRASSPQWLDSFMRQKKVFPNQKNGLLLSHDAPGARCRGLEPGRSRSCMIPARACEDAAAVTRNATGGKMFSRLFYCAYSSSTGGTTLGDSVLLRRGALDGDGDEVRHE